MAKLLHATSANSENNSADFVILVGIDVVDEKTGETTRINLPQAFGLDTMRKSTIWGEGEKQDALYARDQLLENLIEEVKARIPEGQSLDLDKLRVSIYHKKPKKEVVRPKMTFSLF